MKWGIQTLQNGVLQSAVSSAYIVDSIYVDKSLSKTYDFIGDNVELITVSMNRTNGGGLAKVIGKTVEAFYEDRWGPYELVILGVAK